MDAVGGQMNAYTTRDNTCFYARVLDTHLPLATDTLCAMFFDSRFDEGDMENEKGIIQEEIDMYEDTPEDVAAERLIGGCFPGALGRPVLGRSSSLARQTGESLRTFMSRHYAAPVSYTHLLADLRRANSSPEQAGNVSVCWRCAPDGCGHT